MSRALEEESKRRRSLPIVLVELIETAPNSPKASSMMSLDSVAKVRRRA